MAAATSFAPASLSSSSPSSKTLKTVTKILAGDRLNVGFLSSSSKNLASLAAQVPPAAIGGGSALGARMVSMPAIKPLTSLDFDTSVFKKEKVNLAGHDEVILLIF